MTETWDFNGSFIIEDKTVKAEPGDEGMLTMRLKNDGDVTVAASLTASKTSMDEAMKKRIYFYVDTTDVRSDEFVDRVWISLSSSYTYTVFSGDELVSGEDFGNIPPLKWVWVYDVLGYYVKGSLGDNGKVTVEDYIRPVEYDFDEVYTAFDSNGKLIYTDGKTSVNKFIEQLTSNDGYEGVVKNYSELENSGYCPIDVNDDGYGVWLYLCTRDEIIENFHEDARLAEKTDLGGKATINIAGVNSDVEPMEITTTDTLKAVLSSKTPVVATLKNDVKLSEVIKLTDDTYAVIDLNGHSISSSSENIFYADAGASLTLTNGKLVGNGTSSVAAIKTSGAKITLKDVDIEGVEDGIAVFDHSNTIGADSEIYVSDCNITCSSDAFWVYGNKNTKGSTKIVIENSSLSGTDYAGIVCNGSYTEIDITVKDSTVYGYYAGIYFPPKDSTLNLINSNISGKTGICVKGGTVNVVDCTVAGISLTSDAPAYITSGWSDTGDGIYLEASYEWDSVINISGSKTNVTSVSGYAVRQYKSNAPNASIIISGGTFDSDVSAYLAASSKVTESDGVYTVVAK